VVFGDVGRQQPVRLLGGEVVLKEIVMDRRAHFAVLAALLSEHAPPAVVRADPPSGFPPSSSTLAYPLRPIHSHPLAGSQSTAKPFVVGRLCDKRPFSDADPTMATIPNQNTADRLSDVIDEGDAIIHHIRITIPALHDSRAVSLHARRSASIRPGEAGP
jgi:hypothetical protein